LRARHAIKIPISEHTLQFCWFSSAASNAFLIAPEKVTSLLARRARHVGKYILFQIHLGDCTFTVITFQAVLFEPRFSIHSHLLLLLSLSLMRRSQQIMSNNPRAAKVLFFPFSAICKKSSGWICHSARENERRDVPL